MLVAAVNTSASPRNVMRKTKSAHLWANPRDRFISPALPPALIDDKEKIDRQLRADCVQDYSPCSCSVDSINQISVECEYLSVQTVRDVFQRVNDTEIFQLSLYALADADTNSTSASLPVDFLGITTVTSRISINCGYSSDNAKFPNLVIDPLAFRSSQNSLTTFSIAYCNFVLQTDFNFLNGFNRLEEFYIFAANNLTAFQYLPALPSLQYLTVAFCPEFNQIPFPDLSSAKLVYLNLYFNEMSDQKADGIVDKLADSNSANSLEKLDLYSNALTRIPSQVGSAFPKLKTADLGNNNISQISSLTFSSPYLEYLDLILNNIKTIESRAFQGKSIAARENLFFGLIKKMQIPYYYCFFSGNFTMTWVDLGYNQLVVFEEGVFKAMLQQMMSIQPTIGYVDVSGSIFFNRPLCHQIFH